MSTKLAVFLMAVVVMIGGSLVFFERTSKVPDSKPHSFGVAGDPFTQNVFNIGGVQRIYVSMRMNTASTTACSVKPAVYSGGATTTLLSATAQITVSTTTAMLWEFGKGSKTNATTTGIGTPYSIPANVQASVVASTSVTGAANVFGQNDYLNLGIGLATAGATGTYSLTGTCNFVFQVL